MIFDNLEIMKLNKNHPLYRNDIQTILSINGIDILKGKSVLITGASRGIGASCALEFAKNDYDIIINYL